MNHETQPDPYDRIIAAIDRIVGELTELLYEVRTLKLDADAQAKDSAPLVRDRFVSPAGDRRERPVVCMACHKAPTFALDRLCDKCAEAVSA